MKKVVDNMQSAMYSVGVASNKRHNTTNKIHHDKNTLRHPLCNPLY
jgi:hypothetical protein